MTAAFHRLTTRWHLRERRCLNKGLRRRRASAGGARRIPAAVGARRRAAAAVTIDGLPSGERPHAK